jgi:hypothetical protein
MFNSFAVQAFGTSIRAAGSSHEALALLDRCIFPSFPRTSGENEEADLSLWLEQTAGRFELSAGGVAIASASEAVRLAPAVVRVVDEAVIRQLKDLRALYAGVVAWDDRALLLPGPGYAGKTSLVAELLRRGATYYSDEYAAIDGEGKVHPYPGPLLLRDGRPDPIAALPKEFGSHAGTGPARVNWIIGVRYEPDKAWNVTAVPQSEGVMMLLQNTPHVWARTPDLLDKLQRAVEKANCFAGTRGETADAAEEILRLVTGTR